MRPFESYIIYLAMYVPWHGTPAPYTYLAALALAGMLLAHLIIERPRWQLTLAYVQVLHLLYSILISTDQWPGNWTFIILSEALLLFSSAIACLFPIAQFPPLAGPYQTIGIEQRFIRTWTESTKPPSSSSSSSSGKRTRSSSVDLTVHPELGLHVFYPSSLKPAVVGNSAWAPFISKSSAEALSGFLGMPKFLFGALHLARLRAILGAPMESISNESKLPWIVFSHGLGGMGSVYSIQCSELASQGYIVFAPTHNDGSSCLSELRESSIPYRSILPLQYDDPEAQVIRASQLRTRVQELKHVIDTVIEGETKSNWLELSTDPHAPLPPYAGRIDLSQLSLIGHSFGGATCIMAASTVANLKSVIVHDPWTQPLASQPPPTPLTTGIPNAPLLVTVSDEWAYHFPSNQKDVESLVKATSDSLCINIRGARHSNYSDVPLFATLVSKKIRAIGADLDFRTGLSTINRIQSAYLAKYTQGNEADFSKALKKAVQTKTIKILLGPDNKQ